MPVPVPLINTDRTATVDDCDAPRVLAHRWSLIRVGGREYVVMAGTRRPGPSTLGSFVMQPRRGRHVRFRTPNRLDHTRSNLRSLGETHA